MINLQARRQVIPQTAWCTRLAVPATPARRSLADAAAGMRTMQIDSMILSLHVDAAQPVYFGDAAVIGGTATNGMQILPGEKIMLSIDNERPIYEIQAPLVDVNCTDPLTIPLVVWPLDYYFVTADAAVDLALIFFPVIIK
jgi:hypothetical protein